MATTKYTSQQELFLEAHCTARHSGSAVQARLHAAEVAAVAFFIAPFPPVESRAHPLVGNFTYATACSDTAGWLGSGTGALSVETASSLVAVGGETAVGTAVVIRGPARYIAKPLLRTCFEAPPTLYRAHFRDSRWNANAAQATISLQEAPHASRELARYVLAAKPLPFL